jgi:hypothetical protein
MVLLVLAFSLTAKAQVPVKGAINPDVTQNNIQTTICVPNYTKTIRPKASYTNKLKLKQMKDFALTGKPLDYEEDHLISLELGGHPTSPDNLWPQPWAGSENAHMKDVLENRLHKLVCAGIIELDEAQTMISTDWEATYREFVKN